MDSSSAPSAVSGTLGDMATIRIYGPDKLTLLETHENVKFSVLDNEARWSSGDFEQTGRIENAQVSLSGEAPTASVSGWAAPTIHDTATWQRWEIDLR